LLETVKLFVKGQGTNPYERQQASAARREDAVSAVEERLGGLRLRVFHSTLAWAQRFAPLREDGLVDIGLAYPLLRELLREVGGRLVAVGSIKTPDDVFWLTQSELSEAAAALDHGEPVRDLADLIPLRKAELRAARRVTPPQVLRKLSIFGKNLARVQRSRAKEDSSRVRGVAASPGTVTARACVVHGPEDFAAMQDGDVLIAPITTLAWTPLFARAAAVVTDVGGPLSHGSIVAREYGIPAVLGTGTATKLIKTGQTVTVDGSTGTVTPVPVEQAG
jgi:pyruvate,water dikinase